MPANSVHNCLIRKITGLEEQVEKLTRELAIMRSLLDAVDVPVQLIDSVEAMFAASPKWLEGKQ